MRTKAFFIKALLLFFAIRHFAFAELQFEKSTLDAIIPPADSEYRFVFPFKNIGKKEIKIIKISTTCGCTEVSTDKDSYSPGDSGKLVGIFKVGDRIGQQKKKIYLTCDDSNRPKYILSLNFTIPILAEIRPKVLMWNKSGKIEPKFLNIDTAREYGAKILEVKCQDKNFIIDFNEKSKNAGSCKIAIKPQSLENATTSELILKCADENQSCKLYKVYLLIR